MSDLSFGQPLLGDYKPYLTRRDVKGSNARSTAILGSKTGRVHQLLSDLETRYFYYLEWANNVTDIREQFPLDLETTKQIATNLGVKHHEYENEEVIVTTDFVITINDEYVLARTVKPAIQLDDKRILEKFTIEKRYWESKGVSWGIVTEKDLEITLTDNIKYFFRNKTYIEDEGMTQDTSKSIIKALGLSNDTIAETLKEIGAELGLEKGQALSVFKSLVAKKVLKVNMLKKFRPSMKCTEVKLAGEI